METKDTDKLLRDFFAERKQEVADNGFTQKVMLKLPEQTDYSWLVWFFLACGLALTLFLGIKTGLFANLLFSLRHVSPYYLLGAVFSFPLVSSAFYFMQNNRYKLI